MHGKSLQSCPPLCNPMDYSPPGSSVHGILQQEYWSGLPCPPPGDLPNSGIEPRSPTLQADSLPAEPQGKPKNTGVGSLSLLQLDLPDPGIKLGSPECRWFIYQLNYQGSPFPSFSSAQFSRSVVSNSLQPHEPQNTRPSWPSPSPGVHPNSCPSSQ